MSDPIADGLIMLRVYKPNDTAAALTVRESYASALAGFPADEVRAAFCEVNNTWESNYAPKPAVARAALLRKRERQRVSSGGHHDFAYEQQSRIDKPVIERVLARKRELMAELKFPQKWLNPIGQNTGMLWMRCDVIASIKAYRECDVAFPLEPDLIKMLNRWASEWYDIDKDAAEAAMEGLL